MALDSASDRMCGTMCKGFRAAMPQKGGGPRVGVIEPPKDLLKGASENRRAKTPARIAPVRPSEVAQGGFVTLRVVDKVWVGLGR